MPRSSPRSPKSPSSPRRKQHRKHRDVRSQQRTTPNSAAKSRGAREAASRKLDKALALESPLPPAISITVMKAFTAFWANDFTTKPSPKELLVDDYDNPVSARQALSMDIYEARALAKAVMAESEPKTPASLFSRFVHCCDTLWPIDRAICESDVIAAQPGNGTKVAIERCKANRIQRAECRLVTLESVRDASQEREGSSKDSLPTFFSHLHRSFFGNTQRANKLLQRLSALRGRIALGDWVPPGREDNGKASDDPTVIAARNRKIRHDFAAFRSKIRRLEKQKKFRTSTTVCSGRWQPECVTAVLGRKGSHRWYWLSTYSRYSRGKS